MAHLRHLNRGCAARNRLSWDCTRCSRTLAEESEKSARSCAQVRWRRRRLILVMWARRGGPYNRDVRLLAWALVAAIGAVSVWFVVRGRDESRGEPASRGEPQPASAAPLAESPPDPGRKLPESTLVSPQPETDAVSDVLAGRVVDGEGHPVSRGVVRVVLRIPKDQPVYATAASFDRRVSLDDEGRFQVAVPRHGKYLVIAEPEGLAMAVRDWVNPGEQPKLVADVPATLGGRIARDTGQPVEGASVLLYHSGTGEPALREARSTSSGAFELTGLPAGRVVVNTWIDGLVGKWEDVTLEPGVRAVHDVALEQGLAVSGRVVDAGSGEPVPNARVGGPALFVVADASGAFSMSGFEKGRHLLLAWAKGWIPGEVKLVLEPNRDPAEIVFSLARGELVRGTVVDLQEQPIEGVRVQSGSDEALTDAGGRFEVLARTGGDAVFTITRPGYSPKMLLRSHPAFTTASTIKLEPADVTIAGRVRDAADRALPGVRVQVRASANGGEDFERVTGSDEKGAFEFTGCPRGSSFDVIALAPGLCEGVAKVDQQFDKARITVDLLLGAQPSVTGTVVDSEGASIRGARVVLITDGAMNAIGATAPAVTDSTGRFELRNPFGRDSLPFILEVTAPGFVPWRSRRYRLNSPEPVVLTRTGRIRGQLVDASTGAAITGARLSLSRNELGRPDLRWCRVDGFFGQTGTTAGFDFEAPTGQYWLVPEVPAFASEPLLVEVKPGEATDVGRLALKPGGALEGRILSASGGRAGITIFVRAAGQTAAMCVGETDGTGHYRADTIAPGAYEVFAVESSGGPMPHVAAPWPIGSVRVTTGTPARLDARLGETATLTVALTGDLEPVPEGHGSLVACPAELSEPCVTISALDGTALSVCGTHPPSLSAVVVTGVEPRRWTVSVSLPSSLCKVAFAAAGFESVDATVQLAAGTETRVELAPRRVAPESRPR